MSLVLNTNINSLMAQQNLSSSQMTLSTAMQRLSSGLRVNSAADDAAGYAIAQRMTTQVNGLGQAQRNANDGISLAQVAEGALSELTNNLQSIRELSVQSANATNSASDRAALDTEVQQRLSEINRIATQTTFNGQHVLDGTLGSATFQVGANVGETIGISLTANMKLSAIGSLASAATTASIAGLFSSGSGLTLATGDLTVNGTSVAAGNYTTAAGLTAAINTAWTNSGGTGTLAAVSGNEIAFTNSTGSAVTLGGTNNPLGITSVAAAATTGAGVTLAAGDLTFAVGAGAAQNVTGTFTTAAGLISAINTAWTNAGGSGTIATASGNEVLLTNSDTANAITVGGTQAGTLGFSTVAAATQGINIAAGDLTVNGTNVAAQTYTDATSLATAINTAWTTSGGAGSIASVSGNEIHIDNSDTANAVAFGGSAATTLGLTGVAAAGITQTLTGSGEFAISYNGGGAVDVAANTYTDTASLITAINAAATSAGYTGSYASLDGSGNVVLAADATNPVTVTGSLATALGLTGTTGGGGNQTSTATLASTFTTVDTTSDSTGVNAAVTAVTDATGTSTGVNTAVSNAGTTTNGTATSTGVNAAVTATGTATNLTLATGDLTIQTGTNTAVDMAGTYTSSQDLADAINSKVSGMHASIDSSGKLNLTAADTITLGGTKAGSGTGNLGFGTVGSAIAVSGSLLGGDVLTVTNANDMMQRIDSALTAVSNYNSVLGAIQNRFQSAINSDAAATQNVTSARSRIQDADFAAETSKMTSANILQQAGVSVLAQANSQQQYILKLLQ